MQALNWYPQHRQTSCSIRCKVSHGTAAAHGRVRRTEGARDRMEPTAMPAVGMGESLAQVISDTEKNVVQVEGASITKLVGGSTDKKGGFLVVPMTLDHSER